METLLLTVTNHERSVRPDMSRDASLVERRTCWTSVTERTTFGMCLSRHEAVEIYFTEELRHAETNQRESH